MADLAAEFQQAAMVDVLVREGARGAEEGGAEDPRGGRRRGCQPLPARHPGRRRSRAAAGACITPSRTLCTDNGAMIAFAGALRIQSGQARLSVEPAFDVKPRWDLSSI
jgi:N6-L-threonylcarbamoyladenine synthase